ncbi:MAG: hypothetical protein KDB00_09075, partial [Planctomycetales bacterium]|nr:hypothetical protein [Planctomycetales bacterium]
MTESKTKSNGILNVRELLEDIRLVGPGIGEYLRTLFSRVDPNDDGEFIVVHRDEKATYRLTSFRPDQLKEASQFISNYKHPESLYLKCSLFDIEQIRSRGTAAIGLSSEVTTVTAAVLDIDAGKGGKYAPQDKTLDALMSLGITFTMIVASDGEAGGFHVYLVFDEPIRIESTKQLK